MSSKYRFFILALVIVIALGVYWYISRMPNGQDNANPQADSNSQTQNSLPEGVEVTDLGNGEKLVKNIKDGYEVKVSEDKYLYSSRQNRNELVIQDYVEPEALYGGQIGCQVFFNIDNNDDLADVENKTSQECKIVGDACERYTIEKKKFGDREWIETRLLGDFVDSNLPNYYVQREEGLFTVSFLCINQDFIAEILGGLNF